MLTAGRVPGPFLLPRESVRDRLLWGVRGVQASYNALKIVRGAWEISGIPHPTVRDSIPSPDPRDHSPQQTRGKVAKAPRGHPYWMLSTAQ